MMPAAIVGIRFITQQSQQFHEFIKASMNVANDVKGTMLRLAIVPERFPDDFCRLNLLRRF